HAFYANGCNVTLVNTKKEKCKRLWMFFEELALKELKKDDIVILSMPISYVIEENKKDEKNLNLFINKLESLADKFKEKGVMLYYVAGVVPILRIGNASLCYQPWS